MKKILIIGEQRFHKPKIIAGYEIDEVMPLVEVCNPILRLCRSFLFAIHSKLQYKFFRIKEIASISKDYNEIILFDSTTYEALNELALQIEKSIDKAKTRLHLYLWNKVRNINGLSLSTSWDISTFDRMDSIKYGFRYISTFYSPLKNVVVLEEKKSNIDCFFIGTNKGRFSYISQIEVILKKIGCKPHFVYVSRWSLINPWKYSKSLSYDDVQRFVCLSKSILDITKKEQFGLTLRFMEGIFYNRKIITNSSFIKQYSFYDENKILIIDEHTQPSKIKSFINSNVITYSKDCKEQYTFLAWLNRIINTKVIFNDTML